jgi:hypothetical protein
MIAFKERFKVKLRVEDGSGKGVYVVFDQKMHDLLGKHCHELLTVHKGEDSNCYPSELDFLKWRKLLLKVEKTNTDGDNLSETSFKVKRICDDISIIDEFNSSFFNETTTDSNDDQ